MIEENSKEEKKKINIKEAYKRTNNIITGDVLANLAYSSIMMMYFMFFNILNNEVSQFILEKYINFSSMIFLLTSIVIIEIAYKKEKTSTMFYGLEFFALAIFVLLIQHIPKIIGCDVQAYTLIGSYSIAIYYMLKSAILYTKEKKKQLEEYSDIKEIVKEESIRVETKRKNKKEEE